MEIILKTPDFYDAQKLWNMMNELDKETKFMLFEPNERTQNLAVLQSYISGQGKTRLL